MDLHFLMYEIAPRILQDPWENCKEFLLIPEQVCLGWIKLLSLSKSFILKILYWDGPLMVHQNFSLRCPADFQILTFNYHSFLSPGINFENVSLWVYVLKKLSCVDISLLYKKGKQTKTRIWYLKQDFCCHENACFSFSFPLSNKHNMSRLQ